MSEDQRPPDDSEPTRLDSADLDRAIEIDPEDGRFYFRRSWSGAWSGSHGRAMFERLRGLSEAPWVTPVPTPRTFHDRV
jgi:hypothetical protein